MEELKCTLCENRCLLRELGCKKGRRFYEVDDEPVCTICENHCRLTSLSCYKGSSFYNESRLLPSGEEASTPENLMKLMEHIGHFFFHRRGGKAGQMRILRYLSHHKDLTQKQLQTTLELSSGSMSEIIAKLESKRLVIRTSDPNDRRKKVLNLTDEGWQFLSSVSVEDRRIGLFDCLDEVQRRELASILQVLLENWRSG